MREGGLNLYNFGELALREGSFCQQVETIGADGQRGLEFVGGVANELTLTLIDDSVLAIVAIHSLIQTCKLGDIGRVVERLVGAVETAMVEPIEQTIEWTQTTMKSNGNDYQHQHHQRQT